MKLSTKLDNFTIRSLYVNTADTTTATRQRAARTLARVPSADLAARWAIWPEPPEVEYIRGPEAGLVMVQGRIGGRGDRFNLGEATVTRATVRLTGGALTADDAAEAIGTAYVLGSDTEHAGLAAIFDALLTSRATADRVVRDVLEPLEAELAAADELRTSQARSTVVDFLTVAREHE